MPNVMLRVGDAKRRGHEPEALVSGQSPFITGVSADDEK